MKRNNLIISLLALGILSGPVIASAEPVEIKPGIVELADATTTSLPAPNPIKKGGKSSSARMVDSENPVPLTDRARIGASKKWSREGTADVLIGTNGQVEYAYGQSRPTITCAPLHLCTIQLMEGENITNMAIGDSVRWMVQQATAGDRPVLVVKPTQASLNTNLTVTTDSGRVYYLTLVSDKTEYVPLVGFYDPQAMVMNFDKQAAEVRMRKATQKAEAEAAAKTAEEARNHRVAATVPGSDFSALDFDWSCRADDKDGNKFLPTRTFSGAGHVYMQMPSSMKTGDAPAIFNLTTGEMELLNFRMTGAYYIVDGEPSKLQLVNGAGDKKRSVTCEHGKSSGGVWRGSASDEVGATFPGFAGTGR